MKALTWSSLALLAVLATACDPYSSAPGGTPSVAAVTAVGLDADDNLVPHDGAPTGTGNAWTVDTCTEGTNLQSSMFHITFDRQVDGGIVQKNVSDCTPASGWLVVDVAPAAGNVWYSCYSPSSPDPNLGGTIVVYQANAPPAPSATDPDPRGSASFGDAELIPTAAAVHITSARPELPIDVTVTNTGACPAPAP